MAVTRGDGTFVVRGVPVGRAGVGLDLRGLDPGYEIEGALLREVHVSAGSATQVEFDIARFSSLQGALVGCLDDRIVPLAGSELALVVGGEVRVVRTSIVGSFQFDRVPPGSYRLELLSLATPAGSAAGGVAFRVDLAESIFGLLVRVGCPADIATDDPRIRALFREPSSVAP